MAVVDDIGIWVAVVTGIVTGLGAIYGLWREWQSYRQNQTQRLSNAATVAVRRAEASIMRPLLGERLIDTIKTFVTKYPSLNAIHFCALLLDSIFGRGKFLVHFCWTLRKKNT